MSDTRRIVLENDERFTVETVRISSLFKIRISSCEYDTPLDYDIDAKLPRFLAV